MTEEEKQAERDKIAAEERAKIAAEVAAKDEELRKLKDKDTNFEKVRKQAEDAEAAKKEVEDKLKERDVKDFESARDRAISDRVGSDEKLQKDILAKFDELKKEDTKTEDIEKIMNDAYTIVTGRRYDSDATKRVISSAGGGRTPVRGRGSSAEAITPELREAAAVFNENGNAGLTEDDLKLVEKAAIKRANAPKS